jgi:putative oxidoreductase
MKKLPTAGLYQGMTFSHAARRSKEPVGLQPLKDARMSDILTSARKVYEVFAAMMTRLQGLFLLAIRLYWGWQFMQDGWGKLTHLDRVAEFFTSLNLPAPHMTALMVALIEFCGGFLFTFGIASRLTSLVLFVNMTMAYLSVPDDRVNFSHIFAKPEDFYGASPYTYWFAALLILILGPGKIAVDTLLRRKLANEREHAHTAS